MTGPIVQSHGPAGIIVDEAVLASLELEHDRVFGKEGWRMPSMQQERKESLAKSVITLVREIRSLRAQVAAKAT